MRVVLLQNFDLEAGLANGSQGVILHFSPYNPASMPTALQNKTRNVEGTEPSDAPVLVGSNARYREWLIRHFINAREYKAWPVVQFGRGADAVIRTIYADCSVNWYGADQTTLLSRTQLPLMPGYAITVHKAQVSFCAAFPCKFAQTDYLRRACRSAVFASTSLLLSKGARSTLHVSTHVYVPF
jgi:ATP-dependent DNA helicase PIF1